MHCLREVFIKGNIYADVVIIVTANQKPELFLLADILDMNHYYDTMHPANVSGG